MTLPLPALPQFVIEPVVRQALHEDLGPLGDITTMSVIPAGRRAEVRIAAREAGRIAGLDVARTAFRLIDAGLRVAIVTGDGQDIEPGGIIAAIEGDARAILQSERVALNFLGHLSGIATMTNAFVRAVAGTKARICCTRKTTPGLRALEKYAVRAGGGTNHRFGLSDGILIKDNHIALAGGIKPALAAARCQAGHMVKIEVEIECLDELDDALAGGADIIMLDNMSLDDMRRAVGRIAGRALAEASGGVALGRVKAIAETGVDLISVGAITHSAPSLDVGLDIARHPPAA